MWTTGWQSDIINFLNKVIKPNYVYLILLFGILFWICGHNLHEMSTTTPIPFPLPLAQPSIHLQYCIIYFIFIRFPKVYMFTASWNPFQPPQSHFGAFYKTICRRFEYIWWILSTDPRTLEVTDFQPDLTTYTTTCCVLSYQTFRMQFITLSSTRQDIHFENNL